VSNKKQVQTVSREVAYIGPLPPANEFAKYESALPGAADRTLSIAEKEMEHRHKNDDKIIEDSLRMSGRGQIFALIITILSLFAVGIGTFFSMPTASIAPAIIAIASLASIFLSYRK
jgi:uncharacterized membrane protein